MRLILIRHGDPDYARDDLTPRGQREAALLADRAATWEVDEAFCSPLGRAKATAAPTLAALGIEASTLDWLQEFEAPLFFEPDGHPVKSWDLLPAEWMRDETLFDHEKWLQGEIFQGTPVRPMYLEVCRELDQFLEGYGLRRSGPAYQVLEPCDRTVLFFTHMGISNVLLSHLLNISPMVLWNALYMPPSSLTVVNSESRDGTTAIFRCQQIGDTAHLRYGGEAPSDRGYFSIPTFRG